jgi:plasmid stabilization system protein ParE
MAVTMFKVELRSKAKRDIAMIQAYLSQFYASTPKKFMKEFEEGLKFLSFSPWNMRWNGNSDYRRIYIRRYAVIYRIDEDTNTVRIHRVLHGMRNFTQDSDIELMEKRAEYLVAHDFFV